MEAAGIDVSQLQAYTAPSVTLSGTGIAEAGAGYTLTGAAGSPVDVTASVTGGIAGTQQVRALQVGADGTETLVRDWTDMSAGVDRAGGVSATFPWTPTGTDVALRVEVRDASYVTNKVRLAMPGAPEPTPDPAPSPDPAPVEGEWVSDGRGWWYRRADGSFPKGTVLVIGGSVYRFDESGYMRTGWVKDQGLWFYHQASGAQVVGWVKQGASWFYLDEITGAMVTGWLHLGSSWFYMSSEGVMAIGWVRVGGSWFFLNPDSGAMATGWMMIRGSWYYFDPADGAMVTGWLRVGDSWYFLKESGVMVTGWVWIGGMWYFFSDLGQWS